MYDFLLFTLLTRCESDNAENFKKDGNKHFGRSMYHWAMDNYTAGIKEKCRNKELNAILYTNRAAAQYHLGNKCSCW